MTLSAVPEINTPTGARESININVLTEDNPAIRDLSAKAYRLLVNMLLQATEEGNGLASISRYAPRPYEDLQTAFELEQAGLLHRCTHVNNVGEHVFDGTFYIPLWEEMAGFTNEG